MSEHEIKNVSKHPLSINLIPEEKKSLHLATMERSRPLSEKEFRCSEIQKLLKNNLIKHRTIEVGPSLGPEPFTPRPEKKLKRVKG